MSGKMSFFSVNVSDQELRNPLLSGATSWTTIVQLPAALWPSKAPRACSGRKLPVKGADPVVIEVVASSSMIVPVKF